MTEEKSLQVLTNIRDKINEKGASVVRSLRTNFRNIDSSNKISISDFKLGLGKHDIDITKDDIDC